MLANQIIGNVDVLVISETKLNAFFPIDQYGGGLLVFVREDIPAKNLSSESNPIEGIYVELNFRKKTGCCVVLTIQTEIPQTM